MSQEVADAFDRDVSRTIGLRVASVLALARKDRGDALAPGLLDRGQDPRLVVHKNVVLRWIALLDVIQRLFLVDINQHVAVHGLRDAGPLDLAGQEDDGSRDHDAAAIEASVRGFSRPPDRPEALVKSRSDSKADADRMVSVQRQRQLPSALPGWFIRASLPRLRTSCNGAVASAATDDHARRNKAGAASALVPPVRFTYRHRLRRSASDRSSYHPRVVGLS